MEKLGEGLGPCRGAQHNRIEIGIKNLLGREKLMQFILRRLNDGPLPEGFLCCVRNSYFIFY